MRALGVEIVHIADLVTDLGRVSCQIDMKLAKRGFLARDQLQRPT